MDSNILISKNTDGRKVLGKQTSKGVENKLDKLISYDSKYTFKVFNIKHVENLLNIDYINLNPSDYIIIFKLFNKNLYYDQRICYSLYKSLYDKIPYFTIDELIQLIEYTTNFAYFEREVNESDNNNEGIDSEFNSQSYCYDITIFDTKNIQIYELLKEILSEIVQTIENKLKYSCNKKEDCLLNTYTSCLHSLNRISFISPWKTVLHLSNEITNHLTSVVSSYDSLGLKRFTNTEILLSLQNVCDTISLKCLHTVCKTINLKGNKIELSREIDSLYLSIVDDKDLVLDCYSKGDVQILNYIVNYYDSINVELFENIKPEDICELQLLSNLLNNVNNIYTHEFSKLKDNSEIIDYNTYINIYFKILYSSKFLKDIDKRIFNNKYSIEVVYNNLRDKIPRLFIINKNELSAKNQALLLAILCESHGLKQSEDINGNKGSFCKLGDEFNIIDIIRDTQVNISKTNELSLLDCLNVIESLYNSFGYVHHYATKKMLDRILKHYPKNEIESHLVLRGYYFSSKFPFTIVNPESFNIKMSLDYIKPDHKPTINNLYNVANNRNSMSKSKGNICEFDKVLRSTHNINIYKMYNRSHLSKDVLKYIKKFKSFSI